MPVEFLSAEQKAKYGQFCGEPNEVQLARYFHLDAADLEFILKRRGSQNRLGFALQITSVRFLGSFLPNFESIPNNVLLFIARQLSIDDVTVINEYANRETTRREHMALIRQHYSYREFNDPPWAFKLSRLLFARAWVNNERPSLMFDFATSWLMQNKVLLPSVTTLVRLIAEIRDRATSRLWDRLSTLPSQSQIEQLEALLHIPEGSRASLFEQFKKGPTTVSGPAFNTAIERYLNLQELGIGELDFTTIPPVRFKSLARHSGFVSMYNMTRMPKEKRIAMLVAFARAFEVTALDDALDILDLLITDIAGKAKKSGEKNRLRTLKDLDKSALVLASVCALILNEETADDDLRQEIFSKVSRSQLAESIDFVNEYARPFDDKYQAEMIEQYGRVRRFLPQLLKGVSIDMAPAGQTVFEAFNYLASLSSFRMKTFDQPPLDIVTNQWSRMVFDDKGRVTKQGYTLCFLDRLQDALRRRDVYVKNSDRWGDPRAKLLQGEVWRANRIQVCRSLGHTLDPETAIQKLSKELDSTYRQVADRFDENDSIELDHSGKHPSLTITNLNKLEEPESLIKLNEEVTALLPKVDLTELLLEIDSQTGFASEFTHVSESKARADDLHISICAVLIAEACNIGLEPLIKPHIPALTRHRLSWVRQNYIRAETLIKANARLVDHQALLYLAQQWGGGEVASADGMRFVTPIRTVNAGPNKKYFGSGKGITWYNFISDQYSGFHGIVIPGTLRDSIFILEGLLEQETGLTPREIMSDTAGASNMIFGLFWLLGYQFSPRLADAGEATFWRIDKEADYGILNDLARGTANTYRIVQHWDDMLRTAGSLKLGTVQASELIRSLLRSDRPSGLAQAIIEVGRINKTIHLLNYIDDEDYRRRILTQLNRGEGRHSVARIICHGQRGEIRKRYREGQEDQLGALGLVLNAVVLWNTIYMEAALNHLRPQMEILDTDVARLSPLLHNHINVLGHYSFTLTDNVANGKLRPLNLFSDDILIP